MVARNRVNVSRSNLPRLRLQAGRAYVIVLDRQSWVALEVVKTDGSPADGVAYRLTTAAGAVIEGRLDSGGRARATFAGGGACRVSFPDQAAGSVALESGPADAQSARAGTERPAPARDVPDDHWAKKVIRDGLSFEERWRSARERPRTAAAATNPAPQAQPSQTPPEQDPPPPADGPGEFRCEPGQTVRFVISPPGARVLVSAGPRQRFSAADRFTLAASGYEASTTWSAGTPFAGSGRVLRFSPLPPAGATLELRVQPADAAHRPYVIAGKVVLA